VDPLIWRIREPTATFSKVAPAGGPVRPNLHLPLSLNRTVIASSLGAAVIGLLLNQAPPAKAANVSFEGVINDDAGSEISQWKTAGTTKSHDGDGDNVYGTLAHLFYRIIFKGQNTLYTFNSSDSQVGPFAGYALVDHPDGVSADTQVRTTTNNGAGLADDVMFTFTALAGSPANVRIGIVTDGLNGAQYSPASIGLRQVGGSSAEHTLTAVNNTLDMVFFNVTGIGAGDQFEVFGDSGTGGFATHQIVTWDVFTPTDLNDPTDTDNDGMGDNWERFYFNNLDRDGTLDFDSDGRTDLQEWSATPVKTDPTKADIDNDGLNDGQEFAAGTDPFDSDSDDDGWNDGDEISAGTDPNNAASVPTSAPPGDIYAALPATPRDAVVVFNEIHYHPAGDSLTREYVELYNQMSTDIDLSNWTLAGDIDYDFPEGTVLGGGKYLVVAKDPSVYAGALGPFTGTLSNSGGRLRLYTNNRSFRTLPGGAGSPGEILGSKEGRRIMDEIEFTDVFPWPSGADGSGATLAKRNATAGTAHPANWTASYQMNGTPGSFNHFPPAPSVAFNEIAASTDASFRIELTNWGTSAVTLDGMVVASSDVAQSDYILPAGTLGPKGFLVIDAPTLGFTPADNNRLFLYSAGRTALIDSVRADDRANARMPDGTGRWMRPDTATFGSANAFALRDDIVINEIFYHAYPQRETPGTPPTYSGTQVLNFNAIWRYNIDGGAAGLPAGWATMAHAVDGVSWGQGEGLLGVEETVLAEPLNTPLNLTSQISYYFETDFSYNGAAVVDQMVIDHFVDDGAVFYLNGVEIARVNMPGGSIDPATFADPGVPNAALGSVIVPNPNIQLGINRLSVEVHQVTTASSDVVLGARVTLRTIQAPGTPGTPYAEDAEEWIELFNRSASAVNLSGWKLGGGISYVFPASTTIPAGGYLVVARDAALLALKYPALTMAGDYSGTLGNSGDLIVLEDPVGNPADEVRYHDSGKWDGAADAGGSSLELIAPDADNRYAGAWAASDESSRTTWQTYTYEGVAIDDGIGNNVYHEFLLGMLDAGEFLLDEVSVIENGGLELIQNGDFEADSVGAPALKWRALGTHGSHGRTVVVNEGGNKCLRVVSTGPTEDKHNKLETTLANGKQVVPGNSYRISFRAKWISGSNQVNTRLYFNYLQRTTNLVVPGAWGTPGLLNSRAVANAGPTFSKLSHRPAVPAAGAPVTVSIEASDPDGIGDLTLFYSVNGGAFQSMVMNGGVGVIPGQNAAATVRFYVRGRDSANATAFYPAAGPASGAFYQVQDGLADTSGLRKNFRIIMAASDRDFLFLNTNRLSNDDFPVTVIEDEKTAYYDVGLRLKASAFGRFQPTHYGFSLDFQPDQLFRGVHASISIERAPLLKEILAKHLINRAGGVYASFYDDVAHIITPIAADRGVGLLSMARHTDNFFDGLFPDAAESGTLFNQELLYNPNGTTGGPEGLKIGNPYNHTGGRYDLVDRGGDKEPYRWGFQIRSARGRDDYSRLIALNQAMSLSGTALKDALDPLIDVDQWMRTFAMMSLNGTDDVFSRIWEHNFRYYVRPSDQKIIVLQWDLDRSFQLAAGASVIPDRNTVVKLFSIPQYRRLFDGHLDDLIDTTFNSTYMTRWASHFTTLTGHGLTGLPAYVTDRASTAQASLPAFLPFQISTNGGADFSEADSVIVLEGEAWIDVFSIQVNGIRTAVTWTDSDSWMITVPIPSGATPLSLVALDNRGTAVGGDSITVTNTSTIDLANASNTIISEFHYHPADPSPAEINAGFIDTDMFEFVELTNTGVHPIDLTKVAFTAGIAYTFPVGMVLQSGEQGLIVSNQAAFDFRYGAGRVVGQYTGNLKNSGERIRLEAADTTPIADFTFGDAHPWPESADGVGYSLVLVGSDPGLPLDWRPSTAIGGNPGGSDSMPFVGGTDDLIPYALAGAPVARIVDGTFTLSFRQKLAADAAVVTVEFSVDMVDWTTAAIGQRVSSFNEGDGTATVTYRAPFPAGSERIQCGRVRIDLR
jgi:hypothetical protein